MSEASVEFYFDVVSPYSWFGFEQVIDPEFRKHYKLQLKPFFLGGVMKATGNKPPATLPARGKYMLGDLARTGAYLGMKPLRLPSRFPINSLMAQRVLSAVALQSKSSDDSLLIAVARAFWVAYWTEDADIGDESVLQSILQSIPLQQNSSKSAFTSETAAALLAASKSAEAKQLLQSNTESAIAAGAFGAPTFLVRKTPSSKPFLLFGSDRFPILFHQIGVKNPPLGPKQYSKLVSKL